MTEFIGKELFFLLLMVELLTITFSKLFAWYLSCKTLTVLFMNENACSISLALLPMQSVPITTNVHHCEFETHSGEVYSMQHYVINFVSDLQQVGGFLRALCFPPIIKLKCC
jgi:hypothetical protein